MTNAVSSIIRASTRKYVEPLNILTFPTHERYETLLARTGHNFYAYRAEGIKEWNHTYAKLPENYTLLDKNLGDRQIPLNLDFDLILSQNKFGQFQLAESLARRLHLPLVSLEHTLPMPEWGIDVLQRTYNMRGVKNVFISGYSIKEWRWLPDGKDTVVIKHGVDAEKFSYGTGERENNILSVVNDWINRDWCCGFHLWRDVIQGLPYKVIGDTPGLSEPASSTEELVAGYQNSRIFLNTSTISPVPTALLEAMSCGCAVVSTATCMIPEVIDHGVNGFISNDPNELKQHLVDLLNDEDLAKEMGLKARQTIEQKFSEKKFIDSWNEIFKEAANTTYRG